MRSSFIALVALVVVGLVACGDLEPVAPHELVTDPEQLFARLTLDHGVINMSSAAPHNTFQLTATPRNGLGAPMSGLPAPTFRSTDTTRVQVSPSGLLQARPRAGAAFVIAELVAEGNVRQIDTARVVVSTNPNPPVLTIFSIKPHPDSAVWSVIPGQALLGQFLFLLGAGIDVRPVLRLKALDANGAPISGLAVEYESLTPDIVRVQTPTTGGLSGPFSTGQASIVVRTTAYGVAKADTAVFTVTLPIVQGVFGNSGTAGATVLAPSSVTIQPNGFVFWANQTTQPMELVFDEPANVAQPDTLCTVHGGNMCGSGNISIPAQDLAVGVVPTIRARQFPVPGVYRYRNTVTGEAGEVIVTATP